MLVLESIRSHQDAIEPLSAKRLLLRRDFIRGDLEITWFELL